MILFHDCKYKIDRSHHCKYLLIFIGFTIDYSIFINGSIFSVFYHLKFWKVSTRGDIGVRKQGFIPQKPVFYSMSFLVSVFFTYEFVRFTYEKNKLSKNVRVSVRFFSIIFLIRFFIIVRFLKWYVFYFGKQFVRFWLQYGFHDCTFFIS